MQKIHTLPPHIIARIAAGEVIERPSYALKELVENAVDAGSTSIVIQIEDAGLSKIVVIDNGEGMSREDLLESFRPHTTSKITGDTLHGIKTLGFRGEALSSIAAISNLSIASKIKYETSGAQVDVEAGTVMNVASIGMPEGTVVTVQNLFYTVPARKKFLKSTRTEFRHILDVVTSVALSYPAISFKLTHDKKIIVDLPATKDTLERVKILLGDSTVTNFVPTNFDEGIVKISGWISKPQLTTYSLDKHYIFINHRKVTDKLISQSIKESYGNLLDSTAYPIAILFLDVPYEMVDVNVHPRKEQISFINGKAVYENIGRAIEKTLVDHNLTFHTIPWKEGFVESGVVGKKGTVESFAGQLLKETTTPWSVRDKKDFEVDEVFQIQNLYLVANNKKGILLVDQHAAHERILYEQYEKEFKENKSIQESKELEKGVLINVSIADSEILEENLEFFTSFGFSLEAFGINKYVVNRVPALFQDRDIEKLIQEILDDIREEKNISLDKKTQLMLSFLACRSAIMKGEKITSEEAKRLIEKLKDSDRPWTCPHGRPTMVEITAGELDKLFKRT